MKGIDQYHLFYLLKRKRKKTIRTYTILYNKIRKRATIISASGTNRLLISFRTSSSKGDQYCRRDDTKR